MEHSKYTAGGERFDIERTTLIALSRFEKDGQPFESGSAAEDSNGNGYSANWILYVLVSILIR